MNKKIVLGLLAVVVVAGGVAGFSAYEAHVINVTAKIENALTVDTTPIEFGTVFPQEYLEKEILISLSGSFLAQDRLDNVKYVIKQKPKVRPNDQNPEGDPYETIYPSQYPDGIVAHEYCLNENPTDIGDPADTYYVYCYPDLCPYLSKHKAITDNSQATDQCVGQLADGTWYYDCGLDAFHNPGELAYGYLIQSVNDDADLWVIDLDVPCFEGQCAQDWTHQGWELPGGLESEVFGCDIWIEVYDFSEWTQG